MAVFTPDDRRALRSAILAIAEGDARITGGAITGSASLGNEDRWSDIDLAFGVAGELQPVIDDFTRWMTDTQDAVDHLDVLSGSWVYRVFLLANSLQVDLAFAPQDDFRARAASFQLAFGKAQESAHSPVPPPENLVQWAWLYGLHVRSSLMRGKLWQSEHMLSGMRNQLISLLCLECGLPHNEGRGVDRLPGQTLEELHRMIPTRVDHDELSRAFAATNALLLERCDGQIRSAIELLTSPADTP